MTGDTAAFGARLSACRRSADLSQEELAERAGLSIRAVGNLERGRTKWPHPDSVRRLADALGLQSQVRVEFFAAACRRLTRLPAHAAAPPRGQADGGAAIPRQLPGMVRQFLGREAELEALASLLDHTGTTPEAAVISVIGGTAGVGKTALAVRWAHQVAAHFPDGQLYVNLRGYDAAPPVSASEALAGFLRALGMAGQDIPGEEAERAAAYRSLLAGRRVLVLLDNARQAGQVRPLLPGSPTCVTLVTSRDALAGLVARDGARRLEVGLLPLPEAVRLLRELTGRRVSEDPDAAVTLAGQCCRLPLALRVAAELAAARADVPLAGLTAELADLRHRLDVLEAAGDERTAVRAVFSWSYQHLRPGTARAFRLASLHPGPDFDSHATAALTGTTAAQAGQQLDRLARAHLIQATRPGRYDMHDLLRSYARELTDSHDGASAQHAALTRLFDYYLHTVAAAMDAVFPAERHRRPAHPPWSASAPVFTGEAAALAWLAAERTGLAAAAGHMAEHGWPGAATRLSATVFRYLDTAGCFAEAVTIHAAARRAALSTGDRAAESDALIGLGLVDGHQGRHQQATRNFEQALAACRQTGDQAGQARALNYLGLVHRQRGRHQQAISNFEQAAALFRAADEPTGEAYALSNLGVIDLQHGHYQPATAHHEQALALLATMGDRHGQASVLSRLGVVDLQQGHYQRAADRFRQALDQYREIGDRPGEAEALARLGLVDLRRGQYEQAAGRLRQALDQYREIGDPSGQAGTLNGLGEAFLATERPADARAQHAAALSLAVQADAKYEQARAHDGLASAYQASGNPRKARRHWHQALTRYADLGAPEAGQVRARLTAVPAQRAPLPAPACQAEPGTA